MIASERIKLSPTDEQLVLFKKFCGTARFTYNECLSYKIDCYQKDDYSCKVQDLIEHIQDLKYTDEFSWIKETPEAVTKQAIKDLDKAYKQFFKRGNTGFPKFKKKGKCKESFYVRSDKFKQLDATHIKITGVKTPIKTSKHGLITQFLNPRITFDGKYWYLSYSYEIDCCDKFNSDRVIGVDLGIKSLAVTSDEVFYKNINKSKRVKQLEKRKRHLQRKLSRKYQMNKEGSKYVKTNNIIKLEQEIRLIDRKLKNIRNTYIHQVTYDLVKTKPACIVIEDLNVKGMMKNKHLSKSIQQQEFYKFRHYLEYKCQFTGVDLVVADRFFPSSKTCSCCGYKKKFLSLKERTYYCPECGMVMDRDFNAALNLRNYALAQ